MNTAPEPGSPYRRSVLSSDLTVLGLALRTSNEVAFTTIPPHWKRFAALGGPAAVPGRMGDDVFAVYTRFEHEGVDNSGEYTFVIGCAVPAGTAAAGELTAVTVPASPRIVFEVPTGRPDLVGGIWQEIWGHDELAKTYIAEYEQYRADGGILISIGERVGERSVG